MTKPTIKEYKEAKKNTQNLQHWISKERQTIDDLLEQIITCKVNIKRYEQALDNNAHVINTYEIYEELEKEREAK